MTRHAMSRFFSVTESVIDACQRDYRAGLPPNHTLAHLDLAKARIIVAESLEADALLELQPAELVARLSNPASDWALVVAYEQVSALATAGQVIGEATPEHLATLQQIGIALLEKALDSPVASPLVWYDAIFDDVTQEYLHVRDPHAVDLRVRQLAHVMRFDSGVNTKVVLRDLAEAFLYTGQYERGLSLFAALVRNDPTDIWVYNALAFTAGDVALPRLGAAAARRGLSLLDAQGDPEEVRDQIAEQLQNLEAGSVADREDEVAVATRADLQAALTADFVPGPHQPWEQFARALVPELADAFVKEPAAAPDLPPSTRAARTKLGRNDPCWCGSGKKYKHCHMAADRAGSS